MGYFKNKAIEQGIQQEQNEITTIRIHRSTHKKLKQASLDTGIQMYELANVLLNDELSKMELN